MQAAQKASGYELSLQAVLGELAFSLHQDLWTILAFPTSDSQELLDTSPPPPQESSPLSCQINQSTSNNICLDSTGERALLHVKRTKWQQKANTDLWVSFKFIKKGHDLASAVTHTQMHENNGIKLPKKLQHFIKWISLHYNTKMFFFA